MKRNIVHLMLIALVFLYAIDASQAADESNMVGKIVALRGEVSAVNTSGEARKLAMESAIYLEDTIKTGKNGRVQIIFPDKTIISLGRDSMAKIAEYNWDPENHTGAMKTKIKEGVFRIMGGAITKVAPEKFTTETPSATIGIRGSMYAGQVRANWLSVVFEGGKGINITNQAGSVAISKPGFGTHVINADKPPTPPTPFTETEMADLNDGLSSESGKDTGSGIDAQPTDNPEPESQSDAIILTITPPEPEIPPINDIKQPVIVSTSPSLPISTPAPPSITPVLPTTGISLYSGTYSKDNGPASTMDMRVNWQNGKMIGMIDQNFFFGDIAADGVINNVKFAGSNTIIATSVEWLAATSASGQFSGPAPDSFSMTAAGDLIDIASQAATGSWQISMTGDKQIGMDEVSPTGSVTWNGFVLGVADDMTAPINKHVFLNSDTADFSLNLDRDTGTVSGSISTDTGIDILTDIEVGGAQGSAYISDQGFVALLGCSTNCVDINGNTTTLSPHGNFLITASSTDQVATYATWGYWEVAYTDPNAPNNPYHLHTPNSRWIAGETTPAAYIDTLITNSFIGQYLGGAQGTKIDGLGNETELTGGVTDLTLEFFNGTSNAVSGSITFNEVTLPVVPTTNITNTGFTAGISPTGTINGAFYGPNAESIGGTFNANVSVDSYVGVFGGDLQ